MPPPKLEEEGSDSSDAGLVLEEGKTIAGKYKLARPAGFGGMAQLWVATNTSTGAEVCIKVLVPETSDDEAIERFRREAYAAARLSHRAIVQIFDLVELDPEGKIAPNGARPHALAIVMELLHGETLADAILKREKLSLEEALDIFLPVLSALGHAHRAGIVHRDLKPDNIFLATDPDGHVTPKVLDFGVSKIAWAGAKTLTLEGVLVGTPSFMSPEQARGARDIDERSDVFSLGIVLYLLLSGRNPFADDTFGSVVSAIIERKAEPIEGLPALVWTVLNHALEKDPKARFNDATEFSIALRAAAGRKILSESGKQMLTSTPMEAAKPVSAPSSGPVSAPKPSSKAALPKEINDSRVSVPPVGSSSLTPEQASGMSSSAPLGRRRGVQIVGVVAALSAILILAAVVRSVSSTAAGTDPSPNVKSVPSALPSVPPPPAVSTAAPPEASLAPTASATVSAPPPIRKKRDPAPPPSLRPGEEPKNASDPGF